MDEDLNQNDPDDKLPKKKATGPQKYKAMIKKPELQKLAADTTQALSPKNPLMVEKADGSVGQWGNPVPPSKAPTPPVKKQLLMSDKARGLSSNYYPARDQQQGPAIKTIKPSFRY